MELKLTRDLLNSAYTLGKLSIDGIFFCYTVEDTDRLSRGEAKIFGQTAIPRGTYKVELAMSPHFDKVTPRLIDVPEFDGVLIHSGNTAADTEGCIIIGASRTPNGVELSRICFTKLMDRLNNIKDISITIE